MNDNLPILPDDLRPTLRQFLASHSTIALATAGDQDGRPQVAPLFFASDDDLSLYWVSNPDSRHSVNIADWDVVAATIFEETWEWTGIKGIQIEGTAQVLHDEDERRRALNIYKAKFPFVTDKFEDVIAGSDLYVLRPRWIRWLDNSRHFGYKLEFQVQDNQES